MEIKNLTIEFYGKKIFDNFSIQFEENKITGLLAPSGFGKTTLLNYIADTEIKNGRKVSFVFQEPRLIESVSILQNVSIPLQNIFSKNEADKKTDFFIEKMKLQKKSSESVAKLSGGEKQRVALARALAFPSEILLLDEAFNSLDSQIKKEIMTFTKEIIKSQNRTTIFVTHNESEAEFLCDKTIRL